MIDHVSLAVADLGPAARFYEAVLGVIGFAKLEVRPRTVGFGKRYPEFWLNARPDHAGQPADTGIHICLRAPDEDAVRAFHAAAIMAGWTDAGAPGPRQGEMTRYYAAFVQDPDGNKLEAATFPKS